MKITPFFTLTIVLGSARCYVNTSLGQIEGFLHNVHGDLVKVFLGIPFAEPPVGILRFQKPKPVKPWNETLVAREMPPACIQYTTYPFPWADHQPGKSEDCLYLNVYAPVDAQNGSNLAVLFWIHGGGFVFGSNRMDDYDASALAVHGNVIVVTINYRLGLFGFLTSDTEDAPGNLGLHDMVMALQWVNENIESFGGAKNQITVFGESAGSLAVSFLCTSPLAKGLFSKAILESGTSIFLKSNQLELNLALSQRLAEAVGCASQVKTMKNDSEIVVGCLRSKNATYLARVLWSFNPKATSAFFPQYGDDMNPRNFLDDVREGNFYNIPILIGNVKDEGPFLITTQQPEVFGFFGHKNPVINKTHAQDMIRNIFPISDNPDKYAKYYLDNIAEDDHDAIKRQVYNAYGDGFLLCETVYFAESYAHRGNDVFYYLFSHRPSRTLWSPSAGVSHTEEIQFVFGRPIRKPQFYTPAEVELSRKMIEVWTNFARNGIPSDSFIWPKYSRKNPTFIYIDTEFKGDSFGIGPHPESCNIIRDYFGF